MTYCLIIMGSSIGQINTTDGLIVGKQSVRNIYVDGGFSKVEAKSNQFFSSVVKNVVARLQQKE